MLNFWQNLEKPIFALAPMEGVTDCSFREIFARYGKLLPASSLKKEEETSTSPLFSKEGQGEFVMFTEFVNVDGLLHPEGFKRLSIDLMYTEAQRPIVAQVWGREPEKFYSAASLLAKMGFDGIDINFGCPQDKEIAQKTCAALIREPELASDIISATIKGAGGLPVSVKTRLGYSKSDEMKQWISHLLKYPLAAIIIHARTKKEKSKVPAQWGKIKEAVEIRNQMYPPHPTLSLPRRQAGLEGRGGRERVLIIGNGDVKSREELFARIRDTGADGAMVGRGAFGNPWIFRKDGYVPSVREKLEVMLEHAFLFEKLFAGAKNFINMRKNFKAYASGFDGANELRAKLMEANSAEEVAEIVKGYLKIVQR